MKKTLFAMMIALSLILAGKIAVAQPDQCVTAVTGDVVDVTCDSSGYLSVDIATGTIAYTAQLTTTFDYATASVLATATGTFTVGAAATATSVLLTNESSTQTVRFCVGCSDTSLQTTCTFATSGGISLPAGASFGMDGLSLAVGDVVRYCNPAGAPAQVSIQFGRKP